MTKNLIIIGAGQLGSRHLQALAACNRDYSITVVDPSEQSLQVARSRYDEVRDESSPEPVFTPSIPADVQHYFMAIIATNSLHRRSATEQLLNQAKVEYLILEKFLFPTDADFDVVGSLLQEKGVKAYVNTPRRMFDYYQELKPRLMPPINMHVSGVNWGLACNAVHYLDMFSYLSGDDSIEIVSFEHDGKLYESKRSGYVEFMGTITAHAANGSTCQTTCFESGNSPMLVTIADRDAVYEIRESGSPYLLKKSMDESGNLLQIKQDIQVPRQSILTFQLLNDLAISGTCSLPDYENSARMHQMLLKEFLSAYRSLKNDPSLEHCPVT